MNCIEVPKDYHVRVYGPAKVTVDSGSLLGPGYTIGSGSEVVVRSTRGASFYSLEDSRICYVAGSAGSIIVEKVEPWYKEWLKVIDHAESTGAKRIVVVGEPETGKSTLSLWLRNSLQLCLIEADIGQNELGLPGFVAASSYDGTSYPVVNDLAATAAWFVGHVSADRVPDLVVSALTRASRYCSSGYVADTDGYVRGRGLSYKIALVSTLAPDLVVVMGDESMAKRFKLLGFDVLVAPRPPAIRERDRVDRRVFRERAYSMLFRDSETTIVGMDEIIIINHEECRLASPEPGHAKAAVLECESGRYILERPPRGVKLQGRVLRRGWEKGLLSAVGPGPGRGEVPALIETIDYARSKIVLRVSKVLGTVKPSYLVLGYVRLGEGFQEVEKLEPQLYPRAVVRSASRQIPR